MAGTGGRVEEPGRRETVTSTEDVVGLSVLPDASGGGGGAMAATGRVASPRDGHPAASWPACVIATAEVEAGRLEESGGPARGQVRRSSSFVSTATKCDRSPPMHIDHIVYRFRWSIRCGSEVQSWPSLRCGLTVDRR